MDSITDNDGLGNSDTKAVITYQCDFLTRRKKKGIINTLTFGSRDLLRYWVQEARKNIKNSKLDKDMGSNVVFLSMNEGPAAFEPNKEQFRWIMRIRLQGWNIEENM